MKHEDSHTDSHSDSHGEGHGEGEPIVTKRLNMNEKLAEEMKENRVECQALAPGSHPFENKPYYSYIFSFSSKLVTNRGCIKVIGKNFDLVQILQRN